LSQPTDTAAVAGSLALGAHGERPERHIARRMMTAAAWIVGGRLLLRFLSLASLMVLARLLSPDDYGVAAMAMMSIGLLQLVSDIRISQALIGVDEVTPAHLSTAFTLNLLRGLLIAVVLAASAGAVADFMDEPALADPLIALALVALIDGVRNPAFTLYRRSIDFSREVNRQAVATLFSTLVTIAAAFWLRSYWAIVIGTIALRGAEALLTYWRVAYRPRLGLSRWRDFTSFGIWMTLIGLCDYIANTAPKFVIGKALGAAPLGQYTIGREIALIATRDLAYPLMTVIFPGFAALGNDPARLRQAYREVQSTVFGFAWPIGLGTAMLAHDLMLLIAGRQWLHGVPVIQLLAPLLALAMMNAGTESLALAKNESKRLFWRNLINAAASYPLLLAGFWLGGFEGVLYAIAVRSVAWVTLTAWFSARIAGDSAFAPLVACWRSLVAGAAMCLVLALVAEPAADGASFVEALVNVLPYVALGGAVYVAVHLALWFAAGRPAGFEARVMDMVRMLRSRAAA